MLSIKHIHISKYIRAFPKRKCNQVHMGIRLVSGKENPIHSFKSKINEVEVFFLIELSCWDLCATSMLNNAEIVNIGTHP